MHRFLPLGRSRHLALETLEDRSVPSHLSTAFLATDLVSDQPGVARVTDPNLVNAWGISLSPNGGAFWLSSNGTALSTLYLGDVSGSPVTKAALEVQIPGGLPTGQVFNSTTDFVVTNGTVSRASIFIFASESGSVSGWNPQVAPANTAKVGFQAADGAVYTGIALANNGVGNFLYVADFRNGKIDVLDAQFQLTQLAGSFSDPGLPDGFAPFNVASIGGKLYVSYAKQDVQGDDAISGRGKGFISVFDTNGNFLERLASRGDLNAPWGMVLAPATFGDVGNALLVANSGNGRIHAFDPETGEELGALSESRGHPLVIDGLWGLTFGNGRTAGDTTTLYFTAGPDDEAHGLFGKITANPAGTNPVSATLTGGDLVITGSRNDDRVRVKLSHHDGIIEVRAGGERIGEFDSAAVGTIRFNGFAGDDVFLVDDDITATVLADGGAGNDLLTSGDGPSVLLGNAGNDFLFGGDGRGILIGGEGRDFLFGRGNDDILIGGRTAHDTNAAALLQLLDAWNSADSYEDRVAAIRAGTGGVPALNATTVFDDGVRDDLFGGAGLDWFLGVAPDVFHFRRPNEQIN